MRIGHNWLPLLLLPLILPFTAWGDAYLRPDVEGAYQIEVKCGGPASDCNKMLMESMDRLTIISIMKENKDTFKIERKTSVTFSSTANGDTTSTLEDVKIDPENPYHLAGVLSPGSGTTNAIISSIDLTIDPKTRTVSGTIEDVLSATSCDLKGKAIVQNMDLLRGQGIQQDPPEADQEVTDNKIWLERSKQVTGSYSGEFGTVRARLIVRFRKQDRQLVGGYCYLLDGDNKCAVFNRFSSVDYNATRGLLRLIFDVHGHAGEIVLTFAKSTKKYVGYEMSAQAVNLAGFTKEEHTRPLSGSGT